MLCNLCAVDSDMSKVGALLQQKLCGEKVVALVQQRLCGKKWGRYYSKSWAGKSGKSCKSCFGAPPLCCPRLMHIFIFVFKQIRSSSNLPENPLWTRAYVDCTCRYFQLSYSRLLPQNQWYYLFIYFLSTITIIVFFLLPQ